MNIQDKIHVYCPITMNVFFHLENQWHQSVNRRPWIALAGAIATLAIPLLLLADAARSGYRACKQVPSNDYHYFFSTELFDRYDQQLKGFIQAELEAHPTLASLDLVQWIQQPVKSKEAHYQGTVLRLRDLANQKETLDPLTRQFVERLCNWIYTGADLLPTMTGWLKRQMTIQERTALAKNSVHDTIRDLHQKWGSEPRFQGEVFQDYRPYDPRYLGDTPSHFFQLGKTQVIRTPAITADQDRTFFGNLIRAKIVEEFETFLDYAERMGQSHLYINLMAQFGSEKVRNEAIEELERRRPNTFNLLTLSKDCPFYHQANHFADQNDADRFKETFINQMFGENPAYHWPISWDQEQTKQIARSAIDQVHEQNFHSALILDREQRCRFIELAYTQIIESLIREKEPKTCNASCRSCVDRGAANLTLLYAKTQPLDTTQSKETLATIALAPAIIAQSRPMLSHRMHRLHPAMEQLRNTQ